MTSFEMASRDARLANGFRFGEVDGRSARTGFGCRRNDITLPQPRETRFFSGRAEKKVSIAIKQRNSMLHL